MSPLKVIDSSIVILINPVTKVKNRTKDPPRGIALPQKNYLHGCFIEGLEIRLVCHIISIPLESTTEGFSYVISVHFLYFNSCPLYSTIIGSLSFHETFI